MYQPPAEILQKYAELLIKFALGSGQGIKRGDVVWLSIPEAAKGFIPPLRRAVLTAGGHLLIGYLPDDVEAREFFDLANKEQLDFFPDKYYRGLIDQADHRVRIIAEYDKYELKGVDSAKIMTNERAFKPAVDWYFEKEHQGKFTWTVAGFATEAMAKDVGMTLQEYWEQIILACYLDEKDPVARWREIQKEQERLRRVLNGMNIDKLHIEGEHVDLWVKLGLHRQWLGGSGRNIPSFEVFISPDWRETEGHIYFNQPLYHYGSKVVGIELVFKKGVIVESSASENEKLLKDMLAVPGANRIGEYSLTDGRMSRITKVMGETLYDENMGGEQGNTHVAVGMAYKDSYYGDVAKVKDKDWEEMGFNDSAVHTDIISTEKRRVTAHLPNGSTRIIYENGRFTV